MGETRKHYSVEFKKQAVKYVQEKTKSVVDIGEELDVPTSTLHSWIAEYREFENEALVAPEKVRELEKLLKEKDRMNQDLMEQVAILKKAMHIFTKEQM